MPSVCPIPCPDSMYQAPFGSMPACFHSASSRVWVPDLSPRETKRDWLSAMRLSASSALGSPLICAGSSGGPITMKSLYMTRRRLVILPSSTYFFSRPGACASVTSASPRAARARAWPVPTEMVFTVSPVCFSNMGTSTSSSPESWVLVVVDTMTMLDLAAAGPVVDGSRPASNGLRIGAAVTARELERSPALRGPYLAIAESAAMVGSLQVRNLATVGGNLCNAAPSADMAPPLVALEALAVIAGPGGERRVPMADFFTGVRKTVLPPNELLVELIVPPPGAHSGGQYLRHTPRRELDIAVVGVASQLTMADGRCAKARIALASVAPTPVRATAAERSLEGQAVTPEAIERAATLAIEAAQPIDDQRGSIEFRKHLVRVLTRRTLTTARERANA